MNIETIMKNNEQLQAALKCALATMEKKDTIFKLREAIKENQKQCPHYSNEFQLTWVDNTCPYCGKKMEE